MKTSTLLLAACGALIASAAPVSDEILKALVEANAEQGGLDSVEAQATYRPCKSVHPPECDEVGTYRRSLSTEDGKACYVLHCDVGRSGPRLSPPSRRDLKEEEGKSDEVELNSIHAHPRYSNCQRAQVVPDCSDNGPAHKILTFENGRHCYKFHCSNEDVGRRSSPLSVRDLETEEEESDEFGLKYIEARDTVEICASDVEPSCGTRPVLLTLIETEDGPCLKHICGDRNTASQATTTSVNELEERSEDDEDPLPRPHDR